MTAILGLNAYHGDAAAALVVDGQLVAAAEEERFTRVSHAAGFPSLAAQWCLGEAGIRPRELDHVATARDRRANLGARVRRRLRDRPRATYLRRRLADRVQTADPRDALAEALGVQPAELNARFHAIEHHRAHAASAFYASPFDEAAVLTVDGFGDYASTMLAVGRGNTLDVLDRVLFPHSLGVAYTAVTQWLGFPDYGDEGKVMGLAPYGRPTLAAEIERLVRRSGGLFELDLDYFTHHVRGLEMTWAARTPTIGRVFSHALEELLGPARRPGEPIQSRHEDVASSLQHVLEDRYLHLANTLWARTRIPRIALAGGVALNAVANARILAETPFTDVFIQPAAGDDGTALGAALDVWHRVAAGGRGFVMRSADWGPQYDDAACAGALAAAGIAATRLDDDELFPFVARRIAAGDVVGWFQGRMEFGPRALGQRSILADPRREDVKDVLNARIKRREPFRPFAPSVLADRVGEWFEQDYPSPFMVLVYKTRTDKREVIPGVNHVDDTGRVQSVERDVLPRYAALISAFEELTGVPILLNTSFNEDEPIVMTPAHAIETFQRTHMDVLVLGNHVARSDSS
ncbi:MAG: carbamoyltransferase [Gaiellaceae bacterium]